MGTYNFATKSKSRTRTTQRKPIPGREEEMKKSFSGGYAFKAENWQVLKRWLLTGSMFGAFYQGKEQMTEDNVKVLKGLINEDPKKVAEMILECSKKGINVHTPIFALVHLSNGDGNAKNSFREVFSEVIRNGSQLYEFISYVKDLRGFGKTIHKAVKSWLDAKDVKELEYQFLKYQNRNGWSGRDLLRMIKPSVADNDYKKFVYNWMVGGTKKNPLIPIEQFPEMLGRIKVYEQLKKGCSESDVIQAIDKFKMTWEMIPGNITMTGGIWSALFKTMPVGATVRNLGNLTEKGVFKNKANLELLEQRFSKENLKKAYIHPINLASAQKIYSQGGEGGKSKLRWDVIPRVEDIIEQAINDSFEVLEPTGKHFFHALDVSGSMHSGNVGTMWLAPYQVEGIMALASIKAEKDYFVGGFDTQFTPMKFRRDTPFKSVTDCRSGLWPSNFGGTDASAAYDYAIAKKIETDVFVFWTDSESWAGRKHPSQAFAEYKNRVNKNAKAIYITLTAYGDNITLADPKDPQSYDFASFTGETPKLIQMVANGEL
jgi:60 kDa SS-A/Ro ribonucleoprotein